MTCPNSAIISPLISREQAGNKVGAALRLYVGRGRRYSVKQLSNATGVKDRVIECATYAPASVDYRPLPLDALLSISLFLGAEFTSEWLSLADQGAFLLPQIDDTPPGVLAADNAEDNATIARAAVDGVFDHAEKQELRPVGVRMMTRGATLARMGDVA